MYEYAALVLLTLLKPSSTQTTTNPQEATTSAVVYGYPLLSWQQLAGNLTTFFGANTFLHAREFATPENRTVVKPNVDTLYSSLVYDLSSTDLIIDLPEVFDEGFKLMSLYDPYGFNWANVGTGGFDWEGGRFLLRSDAVEGEVGLQGTDGGEFVAELIAPSPFGTILIRWGVDDEIDEEAVHQYQDATSIEEVLRSVESDSAEGVAPTLESLLALYDSTASPAENVLVLLAGYEENSTGLTDLLQPAGISNGQYTPQPSVDLTLANNAALLQALSAGTSDENQVILNNGWSVLSPALIGVWGTDYALRTAIAISGYLALRNPFAVYPTGSNSSGLASANGGLELGADEAIIFTFSGRPPVQSAGFWSLTLYGSDNFLIPNPIDTYALGDRSGLTYPDGELVYGDGGVGGEEEAPFEILVQPADIVPPANWTNNWLPAPSGGGAVVAQLRLFAAFEEAINGVYEYPSLRRVAAIRGAGGNGTVGGGNGTVGSPATPAVQVQIESDGVRAAGVCSLWAVGALLIGAAAVLAP